MSVRKNKSLELSSSITEQSASIEILYFRPCEANIPVVHFTIIDIDVNATEILGSMSQTSPQKQIYK